MTKGAYTHRKLTGINLIYIFLFVNHMSKIMINQISPKSHRDLSEVSKPQLVQDLLEPWADTCDFTPELINPLSILGHLGIGILKDLVLQILHKTSKISLIICPLYSRTI